MRTRRSVVASADPEGDLPQLEVGEEFIPFGGAELAVFFAGPFGSAAGDESPMVGDHVLGVDRLWRTQISQLSEWVLVLQSTCGLAARGQPHEDEVGGVGDLEVSGFDGVAAGSEIDADLFFPVGDDLGIAVDGVEEDERFGDFPAEPGSPVDGRQELEGGFEDFVIVAARDLSEQDAVAGR
jgi:hypothetical protein